MFMHFNFQRDTSLIHRGAETSKREINGRPQWGLALFVQGRAFAFPKINKSAKRHRAYYEIRNGFNFFKYPRESKLMK